MLLCLSVLEHLSDPQPALSAFRRLTAPGGVTLINVPSWRGKRFLETAAFRLGVSPAEEMDDHKAYYDPPDLWPMLVRAGFRPRTSAANGTSSRSTRSRSAACRKAARERAPPGRRRLGQPLGRLPSAASRNPAQEYRRRLALQLLEEAGPPSRVLDIGSGQGDFLVAARRRWPDAELAGLEASENGVRETRGKVPAAAVHVCDLLAGDPPVAGLAGWATHAVCSEVLEHVDDPVALMRNATAYLAAAAGSS